MSLLAKEHLQQDVRAAFARTKSIQLPAWGDDFTRKVLERARTERVHERAPFDPWNWAMRWILVPVAAAAGLYLGAKLWNAVREGGSLRPAIEQTLPNPSPSSMPSGTPDSRTGKGSVTHDADPTGAVTGREAGETSLRVEKVSFARRAPLGLRASENRELGARSVVVSWEPYPRSHAPIVRVERSWDGEKFTQ